MTTPTPRLACYDVRTTLILGLLLLLLAACSTDHDSPATTSTSGQLASDQTSATMTTTATTTLLVATPQSQPSLPIPMPMPGQGLEIGVSAMGEVKANQEADMIFTVSGLVAEVFVEEGAQVKEGDLLAVLDVRPFDQRIQQAEANLIRAQADEAALTEAPREHDILVAQERIHQASANLAGVQAQQSALFEPASESEIQAAQGQVEQAQGALAQAQAQQSALTEAPRQADVDAAEAQIRQAEAELARLQRPPDEVVIRAVQATVDLAEINLQHTRDQLSYNKTQAELSVTQASYDLEQAQWRYTLAQQYWNEVDEDSVDPVQPSVPNPMTGGTTPNKVSDGQKSRYQVEFEQAQAQLRWAEEQLHQRLAALEQARNAEITGVQAAEQQLFQAQANRDQVLLAPSDEAIAIATAAIDLTRANRARLDPAPNESQLANAAAMIAQAQGGLHQAEANLTRLTTPAPSAARQAQAAAQVAQAQAALNLAQIELDALLNPQPLQSQVNRAHAGVLLAQAELAQARLNREYAELRAPFDGTVAIVTIDPGDSSATGAAPAIALVDVSTLHVEVDISDLDIANVTLGQEAIVTANALPNSLFHGRVVHIAPRATVQGIIRSFLVKIELEDDANNRLRPGMGVRVELAP